MTAGMLVLGVAVFGTVIGWIVGWSVGYRDGIDERAGWWE